MAGARDVDADAVFAAARAGEPDRYLAALLAPRGERDALIALAAFAAELAHVARAVVREPMMGEIRLQWWRDALEAVDGAARTGHPVADALGVAVRAFDLPRAMLLQAVDAHSADLSPDPFADEAALAAYFAGSEATLFTLAALVLGAPAGAELDAACAACGQAYGLARLLLAVPHALARGRLLLPRARLTDQAAADTLLYGAGEERALGLLGELHGEVRRNLVVSLQHVANLPRAFRPAFLPLALVRPYLRALERPGRDPLREEAQVSPLVRVRRIAAAQWLGRF